MIMKKVLLLLLLLATAVFAQTQSQPQTQTQPNEPPPDTDIYIAKLTGGPVHNITHRKGYDNQPYFLPDNNTILYTSIRGDQSDIYRYDSVTGASIPFTNTPESEYSPTLTPDGKYISVVRVEVGETQRLWEFPIESGRPKVILENIKPVGYHAWIDADRVALFILGEPNTLQIANLKTGTAEVIAKDIGRCIQRVPNSKSISFTQKGDDKQWHIQSYDPDTKKMTEIATAVTGNEDADYAWTSKGVLVMASGSKLMQWKDSAWQPLADFTEQGIQNITRIAIDPKDEQVAMVALDK